MKNILSIKYCVLFIVLLIFLSSCGGGNRLAELQGGSVQSGNQNSESKGGSNSPTLDFSGIVKTTNKKITNENKTADTNSNIQLFISATPSMIGFVDFYRTTQYETICTRFINNLTNFGYNLRAYRVDIDIPLTDMQMHSIQDLTTDFIEPRFYTYKNIVNLPGWYGLDEALNLYKKNEYNDETDEKKLSLLKAMSNGIVPSTTDLAVKNFSSDSLNILITDFYDFRQNQRTFEKLSSFLLDPVKTVGIIAVQSGFIGGLPDFRKPDESITVGDKPSWLLPKGHEDRLDYGVRSFYILIAGNYNDVSRIIHDFPEELKFLYGDNYKELIFDAVFYNGLYADDTFDLNDDSTSMNLLENIFKESLAQNESDIRLSVQNNNNKQKSSFNVNLLYKQNKALDTRSLSAGNFDVAVTLKNIADGSANPNVITEKKIENGNKLSITYDFTQVPVGSYSLNTVISILPPDRAFNNLFNEKGNKNLSNWNMSISTGNLYEKIEVLLVEAKDRYKNLIDFPFELTIGLEEFTQSLEKATMAGMLPIKLAEFSINIDVK